MSNFFRLYILSIIILLEFSGCGRIFDRFNRIQGNTSVTFTSEKGGFNSWAALNGGMMIYFYGGDQGGVALGFTSEDLAAGKIFSIPNGEYKVIGLGFTGAGVMAGSAKCARAFNGNFILLSGGSVTIPLDFTQTNCGFTTDSVFSTVQNSSGNGTNFDELKFAYCDTLVSSGSCTQNATNTTNAIRYTLLAGQKFPGGGGIALDIPNSITSACMVPAAGAISTGLVVPTGSSEFSPPFRVTIYNDNSCTTPVAVHDFTDGLYRMQNPANGAAAYVTVPVSVSYSALKIKYP